MAALYGANATKRDVNVPSEKLDVTEQHGRVRRAYDSITLAAELNSSDTIDFMKLPAGAKIIDARVIIPVDGGGIPAGIINIGWTDNGVDGADADGMFVGASEVDFGAGAIDAKLLGTSVAYNKKFSAETLIQAVCTETSAGSSGNVIELEVLYVVD